MAIVQHLTSKLTSMAKYYKYIFLLISSLFLLSSCQEGSEAGDLIGQWRMADTDNRYVAFSGAVAVFRVVNNGFMDSQIYGNFQRQNDSLFIQCYSIKEERSDTVAVEETFGFKPFNNIRVKIETINGDILILSKDGKTWNFRKY